VCEFIALEFDPAMVAPPERAAVETELAPVGVWRERLEADQLAAFEEVGAEMLAELGYAEPMTATSRT